MLVAIYLTAGGQFAGLGTGTIDGVLAGTVTAGAMMVFVKIAASLRVRKGSLTERVHSQFDRQRPRDRGDDGPQ